MSTTHLVWDSGTFTLIGPPPMKQIGPTLDVRKYARIRVAAHDLAGFPPQVIDIRVRIREGGVAILLPKPVVLGPGGAPHNSSVVYDVPGREVELVTLDSSPLREE
jgi:hypothetical protein